VIEVVDTRHHVERPIPVLDEMAGKDLVALEKARVSTHRARDRSG
jgi:PII-like signaling protein